MSDKAGPGVGFEFPNYEVSWLKRDLLLFATSIGATYPEELHFLYVSRSGRFICNPGRSEYTDCIFRNCILSSPLFLHIQSSCPSSTQIKKSSTFMLARMLSPSMAFLNSTPSMSLMVSASLSSTSLSPSRARAANLKSGARCSASTTRESPAQLLRLSKGW